MRGELALGADEEDVLAAQDDFAHELLRELELPQRLLQVDDVDPVALGENEAAHLGIPAAGLVSEVDTGLEELLRDWAALLWSNLDWVLSSALVIVAVDRRSRHPRRLGERVS